MSAPLTPWPAILDADAEEAVGPMCATVEFPDSICFTMASALLIGIAYAWLARWATRLLRRRCPMPSTLPVDESISGPPESPGWIPAFVSTRPVSCSEPPASSLAVIVWRSATILPAAVVSLPVPPALPIAVTASAGARLRRVAELHRLQVRRALQLQHGDVVGHVVAEHRRGVGAVRRRVDDLDRRRALDHVIVRQHDAVGREGHPRPCRGRVLVREVRVDDENAGGVVLRRRAGALRQQQRRNGARARGRSRTDESPRSHLPSIGAAESEDRVRIGTQAPERCRERDSNPHGPRATRF